MYGVYEVYALVSCDVTFIVRITSSLKPGDVTTVKKEDILNQEDPAVKKFFKGEFRKPKKEELTIAVRDTTSCRSFEGENINAFTVVIQNDK